MGVELKVLNKPRFGEPCNGCGECCRVAACHLSVQMLNSRVAPCIALEIHDGKFRCGVVERPHYYLEPNMETEDEKQAFDLLLRSAVKEFIYVDVGCGCPDDYLTRPPVSHLHCEIPPWA